MTWEPDYAVNYWGRNGIRRKIASTLTLESSRRAPARNWILAAGRSLSETVTYRMACTHGICKLLGRTRSILPCNTANSNAMNLLLGEICRAGDDI